MEDLARSRHPCHQVTPCHQATTAPVPGHRPGQEEIKLALDPVTMSPVVVRKRLGECRTARLRKMTGQYRDNMAELYFLQSGRLSELFKPTGTEF